MNSQLCIKLRSFIKRLDYEFLINHPIIWASRLHYVAYYSIILLSFNTILIFVIPVDIEINCNYLLAICYFFTPAVLLLYYWFTTQRIPKVLLNNGAVSKIFNIKSLLTIHLSLFIIFLVAEVPYQIYLSRIQHNIIDFSLPTPIYHSYSYLYPDKHPPYVTVEMAQNLYQGDESSGRKKRKKNAPDVRWAELQKYDSLGYAVLSRGAMGLRAFSDYTSCSSASWNEKDSTFTFEDTTFTFKDDREQVVGHSKVTMSCRPVSIQTCFSAKFKQLLHVATYDIRRSGQEIKEQLWFFTFNSKKDHGQFHYMTSGDLQSVLLYHKFLDEADHSNSPQRADIAKQELENSLASFNPDISNSISNWVSIAIIFTYVIMLLIFSFRYFTSTASAILILGSAIIAFVIALAILPGGNLSNFQIKDYLILTAECVILSGLLVLKSYILRKSSISVLKTYLFLIIDTFFIASIIVIVNFLSTLLVHFVNLSYLFWILFLLIYPIFLLEDYSILLTTPKEN